MKRLQMLLVLLFGLGAAQAFAHDLWVNAVAAKGGPVQAEMGYGHDFPAPEDIPEDRMSIFEPMQLAAPSGLEDLSPAGKSYAFSGKKALSKGSYLVLATYKPTFWTNGDGGWQRKNRLERPDAKHCEEASMFGKAVLNVDGSRDAEFISRPVGQKLEIVPLANPASIKVGERLPVQVLFEGKPLRAAKVYATFAGFSKNARAFYGVADAKGMLDVIPLKSGYWIVKVEHETEFPDKAKCDACSYGATLTFYIE